MLRSQTPRPVSRSRFKGLHFVWAPYGMGFAGHERRNSRVVTYALRTMHLDLTNTHIAWEHAREGLWESTSIYR